MTAEPVPRPSPNLNPVDRFCANYAACLDDARKQAEHTETPGWRDLYAHHHADQRERRREVAEGIHRLADTLQDRGLTEDGEKGLKEYVKEAATIREAHEAFISGTVAHVKGAVSDCSRLREDALAEAMRLESDEPLINIGLAETMRMAIAAQPRPQWDAEKGIVTIAPAP